MTPQAVIVGRAGVRPTMTELLTLENTAIVLDSTCDPPDGFFDRPGLYMVPLKVHFGDQTFRDGVDMTYKEFFARLEASHDPADHVAADCRRVRRHLRGGEEARTSTSSRCTSRAR